MEDLDEAVSVISYYDESSKKFRPLRVKWRNRIYSKLKDVSVPYSLTIRGDLVHIFNVMTKSTQLILHFNSRTMQWVIKAVHDISY